MIYLKEVTKHYPGRPHPALDNLSLHIAASQFVYLTGPSGAGKTTLLRLLFGAELANHGLVKVGGADLGRLKPGQIPLLRHKLGIIFQDFKLAPKRSVFENVALALRVAGGHGDMLVKAVENILTQVGLWDKAKMKAETLSGGEQQRVAVARALVANPPLILADEPTGNLDPANAREVMRLLVKAHLQGSTVLVATHDPTLLKIIKGARVIHLEKGRLRKGSAP